jgi:hypothetical protein
LITHLRAPFWRAAATWPVVVSMSSCFSPFSNIRRAREGEAEGLAANLARLLAVDHHDVALGFGLFEAGRAVS